MISAYTIFYLNNNQFTSLFQSYGEMPSYVHYSVLAIGKTQGLSVEIGFVCLFVCLLLILLLEEYV